MTTRGSGVAGGRTIVQTSPTRWPRARRARDHARMASGSVMTLKPESEDPVMRPFPPAERSPPAARGDVGF